MGCIKNFRKTNPYFLFTLRHFLTFWSLKKFKIVEVNFNNKNEIFITALLQQIIRIEALLKTTPLLKAQKAFAN